MIRKSLIALGVAVACMLPLTAISAEQHGGGRGGGGHASAGHSSGGRSAGMARSSGRSVSRPSGGTSRSISANVHRGGTAMRRGGSTRTAVSGGRRGYGGNHYSHSRHRWHGRWWAYGVGSCWAYSYEYNEYYWTCGDDDED